MLFCQASGVTAVPMFKIYVGNLDPRVKIEQVRELFSPFVTIEDAVLVNDTKSGKPKGFAIIMVRDPEIGRAAVKATQGKRLLGKTLTINEVMKKGQAAKVAKETRQGPFGPHFNSQGGGRAGNIRGGFGGASGNVRRGFNRGPRGPGFGGATGGGAGGSSAPSGPGATGYGASGSGAGGGFGGGGQFRSSRPSSGGGGFGSSPRFGPGPSPRPDARPGSAPESGGSSSARPPASPRDDDRRDGPSNG